MRNHHLLSLLVLVLSVSLSSPATTIPDTPVSRFQNFLRINTAHPNPDYTAAVSFLLSLSHSLSLHSQTLYLTTPTRPLLLLTWPGSSPSLPSLLLNSHLDSVPAEPHKWAHPPFSAATSPSGKIFARGAQDDKSISIQYLEAIRLLKTNGFEPIRTIHISYVPDEEIGGFHGMGKFVAHKVFDEMNVGFMLDEGQASTGEEYRVFYADRTPWNLVIRAEGMPGHGSRMFDGSAMESLMESVEVISRFRDGEFDLVKAGFKANSEVVSVNPVYFKAGTPSPTDLIFLPNPVYLKAGTPSPTGGFVMNMQPSEAEAGFDVRLPPTADPDLLRKRIADEWAPATRNMTYEITEKGPLRDYMGRPLMTATNDSNPWWYIFKQAVEEAGGKLSKPEILSSTTDARFIRQKGIPTLGFSPMKNTPILLHDHNEFLKDTVFLEGIDVYVSIIKALSSFEGSASL